VRFHGDDLYLGLVVALVATGSALAFIWVRRTGRRSPLLHATAVAAMLVILSGVQTRIRPGPHALDVVSAIDARAESLLPPPPVRGERPSTALSPGAQSTPPAHMTVVPVPTTSPSPPVSVRVPLPRARTVPQPAPAVLGTTTELPAAPTTAAPIPTTVAPTTTTTTTTTRRRPGGGD
jgi:hypothetical protein